MNDELFEEQMKNIYENPDCVSGVHGTVYDEKKVDNILNNGFFTTSPNIFRVIKTNQGEYPIKFDNFCNYVYKPALTEAVFVVSIPNDTPEEELFSEGSLNDQDGYYLDPKFIVGYYISHEGVYLNENKKLILNENYVNKDLLDTYENSSGFHM